MLQKMIQYVKMMIQYLHTDIAEDDPTKIDDEDV